MKIFLLQSLLNMIIGPVGQWVGELVVGGRLVGGSVVGGFNKTQFWGYWECLELFISILNSEFQKRWFRINTST